MKQSVLTHNSPFGLRRRVGTAAAGTAYRDFAHTPWQLVLTTLLVPAIVLTAVFAQPYIEPAWLLRDSAVVAVWVGVQDHPPIYYGFISTLGVLIWSTAATVCLFAGALLTVKGGDRTSARFLLFSGAIGGVLVVDDMFMVHELVFTYLTRLDSAYLYAFYSGVFLIYMIKYRNLLLKCHIVLLMIALVAFGASITIDLVSESVFGSAMGEEFGLPLYVEDSAKFFGICAWVAFYLATAWDMLAPARKT